MNKFDDVDGTNPVWWSWTISNLPKEGVLGPWIDGKELETCTEGGLEPCIERRSRPCKWASTLDRMTDWRTDTTENISRMQLYGGNNNLLLFNSSSNHSCFHSAIVFHLKRKIRHEIKCLVLRDLGFLKSQIRRNGTFGYYTHSRLTKCMPQLALYCLSDRQMPDTIYFSLISVISLP